MAILLNPNYVPTSAKRPVEFTVWVASANQVERATGKVYINGVLASTTPLFKSPDPTLSTGLFYYFKFDFQQLIADALAPSAQGLSLPFGSGSLSVPYGALSTDVQCEIYTEFEYYYRDATTNQLVNLGITDTSAIYYILAATRQHQQPMFFDDYLPSFAVANSWLTDAPNNAQDVCQDDNLYLSYLMNTAANTIKVTAYNSSGVTLAAGTFTTALSTTYEIYTIGVGMANLRTQVYNTGGVNIDDPDIAYYTIDLVGLFGVSYLETKRFNKVGCCNEKGLRLHFMNNYATADAFTLDSKQKDTLTAASAQAQKPLKWDAFDPTAPHNIKEKGSFKIQNTAFESHQLESRFLSYEEAQWLKQMLYSPEAYIETQAGFLPIVVNDVEVTTFDSTTSAVAFTIDIIEANEIITLNN
jgi:hypothetical protein